MQVMNIRPSWVFTWFSIAYYSLLVLASVFASARVKAPSTELMALIIVKCNITPHTTLPCEPRLKAEVLHNVRLAALLAPNKAEHITNGLELQRPRFRWKKYYCTEYENLNLHVSD